MIHNSQLSQAMLQNEWHAQHTNGRYGVIMHNVDATSDREGKKRGYAHRGMRQRLGINIKVYMWPAQYCTGAEQNRVGGNSGHRRVNKREVCRRKEMKKENVWERGIGYTKTSDWTKSGGPSRPFAIELRMFVFVRESRSKRGMREKGNQPKITSASV